MRHKNYTKKSLKTKKPTLDFINNANKSLTNSMMPTTDRINEDSIISFDITYLQPPTKSVSDKKEYSVIQLKNGLMALLISDVNNLANINDVCINMSSEDEDSHKSEEISANIKLDKKKIEEKLAACAL